jgi:glycosyltransferase involved in cell wall biosynthesis
MKILIATDAWHPQVNGVVRTLGHLAREAAALGAQIEFFAPDGFFTLPMPSYPEIRLSLVPPVSVARRLDKLAPDAIHIATEGPVGHAMRRLCLKRGLPFTTSFHTRFPDYLAERLPLPTHWSASFGWRLMRYFHAPSAAVMAATPSLAAELTARGFPRVGLWPRGVDSDVFYPRPGANFGTDFNLNFNLPRPVFLTVGRLAPEKNVEAFLALDLPGSKVVVGDGPSRAALARRFPQAVFLGNRNGQALAAAYAAADVFVFPSRTDTYGLVLLEALASGVPVAAFPAAAPRDVVGHAPVGVLDDDLRRACLAALELNRGDCREFARRLTWRASAQAFLSQVAQASGIKIAA